jgi:fructose-1,6-bisphosphatase II
MDQCKGNLMASRKETKKKNKPETLPAASAVKKDAKAAPAKDSQRTIAVHDLERLVELDFIRTTEASALNAFRWLGKGDPQAAHAAAVDAMRGSLDITSVSATVITSDGVKPQRHGVEVGEKLGSWEKGTLELDLATIPIDGIGLVGAGSPGSLSVVVAARRTGDQPAIAQLPTVYVDKIAYGPKVKEGPGQVHLEASVRDNLEIIAMKLNKRVQDVSVAVLDRKRHNTLISKIRQAGATVRLIADGDIAACVATCLADSGIDVYLGVGGAPEAVMAAAAIRCLRGDILVRPVVLEIAKPETAIPDSELKKMYSAEDLVRGDNVIFCATGITTSGLLRGIHVEGQTASTYSVVMRTRFGTVRYIKAIHDLSKKTIRLRSAGAEAKL